MIQVVICDDEPAHCLRLRNMLTGGEAPLKVTEYHSGKPLIWDIETGRVRFDLYFLDIYLDDFSGMETTRHIRSLDDDALIVFVSSSEDYYRESYDLFAFNYLVKPVEKPAVEKVMAKALDCLQEKSEKAICFTYKAHIYRLGYSEIDYITSRNRLLIFQLHNGEKRQCYGKLDDMAKQIGTEDFVRCHKSYLVNLKWVTGLEPAGFLQKNILVPISRSYSDAARERYHTYLFVMFEYGI